MAKKFADGVYDSDPKTNPNAVKFDELTYNDDHYKELKVWMQHPQLDVKITIFLLSYLAWTFRVTLPKPKGEEIGTIVRGE